ncbi:hypothetical protein QL285_028383 [Trifolium repens]|nr:hypothetical protein QL285_028383 [Trifolium repens]
MDQNKSENPAHPVFYFSVVRLENQKYGEVETEFTRRHVGQLCEYWKVKKNDTDFHKIRFNLDYENPLILVQGWNEFKNFHDLPKNVEILFMYRGNNIYEIMETNDLDSRIHIPAFHSRSSLPTRTATFDVELTNLNVDRPKVHLPMDFAEFLNKRGVGYMLLCGDNGKRTTIGVLNSPDLEKMKLGYTWGEFCIEQKFKAGDIIRFKFDIYGTRVSRRCHVYKLA